MTEPTLKEKVTGWFNSLDASRRQKVITGGAVASVLTIGSLLYSASHGDAEAAAAKEASADKAVEMSLGKGLLQDSLGEQLGGKLDEISKKQDAFNERLSAVETGTSKGPPPVGAVGGLDDVGPPPIGEEATYPLYNASSGQLPPPPRMEDFGQSPGGNVPASNAPIPPPQPPKVIGDIGKPVEGGSALSQSSKKKNRTVYLPPSFMKARLITGVLALASKDGTNNPEPIILRVEAPAQLPNDIKANLSGCFVVGNATGSLAKERVEVQLVSLSCVDFKQRSVVDQPIKGFLADTDSYKGLSGRIVTRAGAASARAFMAAAFEGIGQSISVTQGVQSISPLGSTVTLDAEDSAKAGVAGGIKGASEELKKLYVDLARQAGPVVEVGGSKEVVVVIQEGVNLEIKESVDVKGF
jgi:conjugal transfer pilus assembly protein TraB